jgi:Na+/melibiose symporter-like transporter
MATVVKAGDVDMKTELRDDNIPTASLSPVEDTPAGSFGRVLKNRSFLLLWLAQLLSQIVFNAANYGVIAIVTAVTHSTVMVGLAIISFTLPAVPFSLLAGVYVDYLDRRLVLWVSNALRAVTTGLIVFALLWNPHLLLPLFFLTFLISLVTQFFIPPEASAIPLLVSKPSVFCSSADSSRRPFRPFNSHSAFFACRSSRLICSSRLSPLSMSSVPC